MEQTDICGYIPHRLKAYSETIKQPIEICGFRGDRLQCSCFDLSLFPHLKRNDFFEGDEINKFKPILRPASSLYKEMTHKGEKIIPLLKLASMLSSSKNWKLHGKVAHTSDDLSSHAKPYYSFTYSYGDFILKLGDYLDYGWLQEIPHYYRLFDFLNELKIDYRGLIEKGEALSTEDFKEVVYE